MLRRRRGLRWLAPAAVVALSALVATGVFHADATSGRLPRMTPDALIASVRTSDVSGFSGTVVSKLSLGLPELPDIGGEGDAASFTSLLTGSHTLQVWYGGWDKQRIAVLGATDEMDIFRDGRTLWQWSSASRVATHATLPAAVAKHPAGPLTKIATGQASLTPQNLASAVLAAINPSTKVDVRNGVSVADRSAYELVLTPRSATSLVGSVRIAVDGQTKIPLAIQVYPRGSQSPAIDVSYTSIHIGQPAATSFQFSPPSGATVRQLHVDQHHPFSAGSEERAGGAPRWHVTGSAWSAVVGYRLGHSVKLPDKGLLAHAFTPVAGSWGRGRLLQSSLASLLVTRGGWAYVGAVEPAALYAAAAGR